MGQRRGSCAVLARGCRGCVLVDGLARGRHGQAALAGRPACIGASQINNYEVHGNDRSL